MRQPNPIEFVETGEHEKGFAAYFKANIWPVLKEVEESRLVRLAKYKKSMATAIPLSIGVFLVALLLDAKFDSKGIISQFSLVPIVAIIVRARLQIRLYKQEVKSKFLPVICRFFGNMNYAIGGVSKIESKYRRDIFPTFTFAHCEDFIQGEYKGVVLNLHETTLKKQGRKKSRTVFRGLVLELDLNSNFTGRTLLLKDAGDLGNFLTGDDFNGLKRVHLEDPEFEAQFQVFGSDQVEARYVLTTVFMQHLLDLARLRSLDEYPDVQCVLEGNKLIIVIPSWKNLFEPRGLEESALDLDDIHTFLAQMKNIFNLVDVLKLK